MHVDHFGGILSLSIHIEMYVWNNKTRGKKYYLSSFSAAVVIAYSFPCTTFYTPFFNNLCVSMLCCAYTYICSLDTLSMRPPSKLWGAPGERKEINSNERRCSVVDDSQPGEISTANGERKAIRNNSHWARDRYVAKKERERENAGANARRPSNAYIQSHRARHRERNE